MNRSICRVSCKTAQGLKPKDRNATNSLIRAGNFSLRVLEEYPDRVRSFSFGETGIEKGDFVRVSCWAYIDSLQLRPFNYNQAKLVVVLKDEFGKTMKWRGLPIERYINNDNPLIWSNGSPNVWDEVSYFVRIPYRSNERCRLDVVIWNPSKRELFLDNLRIELWEE